MSVPDEIPGLGKASDRPLLNRLANLATLPLTPVEAFVLSRVDGLLSYADICLVTGLGAEQTLEMLRKLKRERIILGPGEPATPLVPPAAPPPTAPPRGASPAPPQPSAAPAAAASSSLLERLDDGSPVDPAELEAGPDLDAVTKTRILRVHRRLKALSARELLGIPAGADKSAAKKAYFAASKELHPDRYFGKNIGPFRRLLNDIFAQLARALEQI